MGRPSEEPRFIGDNSMHPTARHEPPCPAVAGWMSMDVRIVYDRLRRTTRSGSFRPAPIDFDHVRPQPPLNFVLRAITRTGKMGDCLQHVQGVAFDGEFNLV